MLLGVAPAWRVAMYDPGCLRQRVGGCGSTRRRRIWRVLLAALSASATGPLPTDLVAFSASRLAGEIARCRTARNGCGRRPSTVSAGHRARAPNLPRRAAGWRTELRGVSRLGEVMGGIEADVPWAGATFPDAGSLADLPGLIDPEKLNYYNSFRGKFL